MTNSVYLPPSKLVFNYDNQDWVDKEAIEFREQAKIAFNEVQETLQRIQGGTSDRENDFDELRNKLLKESAAFEELFQIVLQPVIDILKLNKLRRQLLVLSYAWDQDLIRASVGKFPQISSPPEALDPTSDAENTKLDKMNDAASSAAGKSVQEDRKAAAGNSDATENVCVPISFGLNLPEGVVDYNPTYTKSFWVFVRRSGARSLLPVSLNETIIPVFDDELTSIIAYALISTRENNAQLDQLSFSLDLHRRVSFSDERTTKFNVTCYYGKQFEDLRKICCPSETDYVRSLSRCKKWAAQGGRTKVFFAKTLDDRFVIKQITKTEMEAFIKFAPDYFKYLSQSISSGSPTCLAKILGIYQVVTKHLKGWKESKMDVLVMENLLFRRNISRLYDLKGSRRFRYNCDKSGKNNVILDMNLEEQLSEAKIEVSDKAKRQMERAVWNDTAFLASVDVMDYSLLVGSDDERHEKVLGIIDFVRQYTWDKHVETCLKTSGILGCSKDPPTIIPPLMYNKRFRKAMTKYFVISSNAGEEVCERP